MADDEKQIEVKKRARRRLVGAAAIALLAVIVLPMVMDSERRPAEPDIQVRIPPQVGDNAIARTIEDGSLPGSVAVVEEAPVKDASAPAAEAREPAAVAERAVAAPAAKQVEEARAPAPLDEGQRVAAILAGKSPAAPTAEITPFVVQLGAYRDRSNATSLQNKLKSDGFSSYTERAGDKTRVRIGPFMDRAEAEAVLARVKRLGLVGTVMPRD